jgi:penicillin-binding protein 1A
MTIKRTSLMTDMKRKLADIPAAKRWKRIWGTLLVLAVLLLIWLVYLGLSLPKLDTLENYNPELASKVYSSDGVLIKEFFTERRFYVPMSQIPDIMIKSVLATEDHRFQDHWGIRPLRFVRAILFDILTLSKQQGASTLTQQLARRLYLTPEKTVTRKIREWLTAIQIERTYTKPEILEMYLNHMSFAHGTYGVEAAAQYLFGKKAYDLTLPESALLTASLQRPAYWNPVRYPERALKRRNLVLGRMLAEKEITRAQYQEAMAAPLGVKPRTGSELEGIAPYFTEWLRQNLQKDFGWDLYKSGMNIYSTLDSRVQACAEEAVRAYLPKVQEVSNQNLRKKEILEKFLTPEQLEQDTVERWLTRKAFVDSVLNERAAVQVAVVAIDPRNGHILALIGGRDFNESKYNRAVQAKRQPGSAFKPIVYTAAVDNGYMPSYEKLNQPVVVEMGDGTRWTPHNYDESISGKTTLREALRRSLNLVTTRLVQEDIPPRQVVQYAHNMGISTHLDAVDALALGSCGVIPLELISAFGIFANHGILVQPFGITRVEDKYGNIQQKNSPQSKGVLREETAYIMADMLRTVAQAGTGAMAVSQYGFTRPAGGKTGTTNDFTDAWYITFTPQIVVGTWVGHDDPALTLGNRQTGTAAALPITATTIKNALIALQLPEEWLSQPDGVVRLAICNETKLLANPACPDVVEELFDVRYQPTENCTVHVGGRGRERDKRRVRY